MIIGFLSHLDLNLTLFRLPVMKELVRLGHTVYAICPQGKHSHEFSFHGINHISYKINRASLNPLSELAAMYAIYTALKPLNLDLLHTFTAKPNIYGTIAGKLAHIPRIINLVEGLGSFYLENDLKSRIIRRVIELMYRQIFKLSEKIMFVNKDDSAYLMKHKIIPLDKIITLKGVGIDTQEWSPVIRTNTTDKIVITMIARALKHKGLFEYIEAANFLTPLYPNIEFRYIGSPDPGNRFSVTDEFMQEQPNIVYLGQRNDIKYQLSQTDIFVLPSYREGLPRTSMEAMSMSIPIVTTNAVGCRETVDDTVNGFIVPIKDSKLLSAAIEKLIVDKELRMRMGKAGRIKAINEFDSDKIISDHFAAYGLSRVP